MVVHALHLLFCGLGRADVHVFVDLHGIAGDDLAAVQLRKLHGKLRLAGGRRAETQMILSMLRPS